ncbi:MAG: fasciclin domain-containing protein [Candidatus Melainabacteria bacterium]|nr:fasciclin domain-containing protein [Candidatus Melainabacteria bacterium]
MKSLEKAIALSIVSALSCVILPGQTALAECSDSHKKAEQTSQQPADIVDTAQSAGSFNTLIAALDKAGLVSTLKGDGPFTVFAPSDSAFEKIPPADLKALLADKAKLTKVLTYHVVPGSLKAAQVVKQSKAETVEGSPVQISAGDDGVFVGGAQVTKTDILCKNGVVHVIDTVIMPPNL